MATVRKPWNKGNFNWACSLQSLCERTAVWVASPSALKTLTWAERLSSGTSSQRCPTFRSNDSSPPVFHKRWCDCIKCPYRTTSHSPSIPLLLALSLCDTNQGWDFSERINPPNLMCEFNICVLYIWNLKGPNDLLKEEFISLYIYI